MSCKEQIAMRQNEERKLAGGLARRLRAGAGLLGLLLVTMTAFAAPAAQAGVPEWSIYAGAPDTVEAGEPIRYSIAVANTGTAPFTGTITVTDILPPGITPIGAQESPCETTGQEVVCGLEQNEMLPYAQWSDFFTATVDPGASGTLTHTIKVEGNGAGPDLTVEEPITIGPPKPFEIDSFIAEASRAGNPETQAGAAPEFLDTRFSFASSIFKALGFFPVGIKPAEHMRTVIVHTPPGVVANLDSTPVRCTAAQLTAQKEGTQSSECPADSQIGMVRLISKRLTVPIYNMVTPPGVPALFGFNILNVAVINEAHLRPSDFGFDLVTRNVNSTIPLADIDYNLWGVPADTAHDSSRGLCVDFQEGNTKYQVPSGLCPSNAARKAFLRLPTECSGKPLDWTLEVDTFEHPRSYKVAHYQTPPQVGCNQLEFTPSLKARPTTNVGDSPAGLEFALHIPQNEDPVGLAEAQLKNLRAVLPEGLVVNPASADGLGSCSPRQIGLVTPVGQHPAEFDGEHANCPDSSKLGSVSIESPAVGHTLPGLVYLATPHENPFGSLLALYLAIDDPQSGIIVKVPVRVEPDPSTGRITTVVEKSAPLPFEDFELELDQGPHAALRTPVACGSYSSRSDLTPWSTPEGQDAHPSDAFEIVKGAGGGACVGSEAAAPGTPFFEAGTLEPRAGVYSPLEVKVARQDGSQQVTGIEATLPKGLLARLSYTTYCPEPVLAAAAAKSGLGERASPSCPSSSQVGTVHVAAGAGPAPLHTQGKAYLTGPYKGGPIGLAIITPAVAGPVDLGNVVVRTAVRIDPETAQVTAVSDSIPHILQGIPLDLRQVTILIDRPEYTLNPTSCDPMSVTGSASLLSGQLAPVSNPFQVGGCASLSFKPKLTLSLKGATKRTKHPALTAKLTLPQGGANIARASVALPRSEFLDQSHIGTVCTRAQFASNSCPAQSVYGSARALTPLLDSPLEGPVYLRSSSNKLPDLVIALRGQIEIDLVGRIDSVNGGIRATFESLPDAPISQFTLKMNGGKKGLLQNSTNICRGRHKASVQFDGQNGSTADQTPVLRAKCGRAGHKRRHRG
jgi:uncharacterized repeat protein (TIGR01451 family)